ncbi:hypothetical protein R1sor_023465 [Riccia sorocarpa]|uniref:Uncharacterized protein n=1 Tax=Riccia sorocarpa TaxID=122646 RepID=A0ABD3GTQ5_9MARC
MSEAEWVIPGVFSCLHLMCQTGCRNPSSLVDDELPELRAWENRRGLSRYMKARKAWNMRGLALKEDNLMDRERTRGRFPAMSWAWSCGDESAPKLVLQSHAGNPVWTNRVQMNRLGKRHNKAEYSIRLRTVSELTAQEMDTAQWVPAYQLKAGQMR